MSFLVWLEQTGLSVWIREAQTLWAFPFILFLHTLGLGVVGGLSVALNLWILGFASRHSATPLRSLFPFIWVGFAINLLSGVLLLVAYPTKALTDPVFYLKIALIVAALFHLEWLRRSVLAGLGHGQSLEVGAGIRAFSVASILLWAGTVLTGRLLAYTYNYMTAAALLAG